MLPRSRGYVLLILVFLLLVSNIFLFYAGWHYSTRGLTFAMLDVGQGDALFVESPAGTQVLIDSGPPGRVISQLSRVLSPFDRRIDAVIITNPDQDHIAGFLDVLKIYKIDTVFEPGTINDSNTYKNFKAKVKEKNIPNILLKRGMTLDMGGGVVIEVLFPDRDVSTWSTNDGSIIARLSYGDTSIMLTGDATSETERIVLKENAAEFLQSDILKVGHHGSRTSTSKEFVKAVAPKYALISDGKNNTYGHPHEETLKILGELGVKVFRTDLLGTIIMKSNGKDEIFICGIIARCETKK